MVLVALFLSAMSNLPTVLASWLTLSYTLLISAIFFLNSTLWFAKHSQLMFYLQTRLISFSKHLNKVNLTDLPNLEFNLVPNMDNQLNKETNHPLLMVANNNTEANLDIMKLVLDSTRKVSYESLIMSLTTKAACC